MEESISKRKIVGTLRHRLVLLIDQYRPSERQLLQNALARAEEIHEDQYRRAVTVSVKRGLPYIAHPMRVALIIMEELEVKDIVAIAGALLHDVVEAKRKKISIADIEKGFGRSIAMMVSILTRPEVDAAASEEEKRTKLSMYHQRIKQASVTARIVKLADRLDSIREACDWVDIEAKKTYLAETRDVYLPLAEDTDSYLGEELAIACQQLEASLA